MAAKWRVHFFANACRDPQNFIGEKSLYRFNAGASSCDFSPASPIHLALALAAEWPTWRLAATVKASAIKITRTWEGRANQRTPQLRKVRA
jgi:hypothetical protein